jgi:Cft2 family RNA processing exonuclease
MPIVVTKNPVSGALEASHAHHAHPGAAHNHHEVMAKVGQTHATHPTPHKAPIAPTKAPVTSSKVMFAHKGANGYVITTPANMPKGAEAKKTIQYKVHVGDRGARYIVLPSGIHYLRHPIDAK